MPLTKEQGERLGRCTETFFQTLNQNIAAQPGSGYSITDHPYRLAHRSDRRDIAFSVSVKAPVGSKHPDTGHKWKTLDGPTWQDCQLIADTCQSDEEVLEQFHNIVFKNIRPMRLGSGRQITEESIAQMIEDQVRIRLEQALAAIAARQNPTANVAVQRIEAGEQEEKKAWQPPKRKEPQVAVSPSLLETWTERAKILGLEPPKIARFGRIDGRWMRNAMDKWRAHQSVASPANPEPSGAA